MYGPRDRGQWTSGGSLSPRHAFLEAGQRYRVTRAFDDFDGDTHPAGEEWTFLGASFLPYDDGLSLFVSRDGVREWQIRMQWRAEAQGPVLDHLAAHVRHAAAARAPLLKLAGFLSAGVAALHLYILFAGAPAYRYFGAGERMARMAELGSPVPSLITAALVAVFAVWAAYAFAGAGLIARPPLLRTGLVAIGLIYTARGLVAVPQLLWILSGGSIRHLLFSLASLAIGLAYLAGTRQAWATLGPSSPGARLR
jgi:hypothetical protein